MKKGGEEAKDEEGEENKDKDIGSKNKKNESEDEGGG